MMHGQENIKLYCECVCSLRYSACNAHAPYCNLWPAPLYNISPHYLINVTIFWGRERYWTYVFWFPLQLLSETFLILRRTERDMIKNVYWSSCKVPYFPAHKTHRDFFVRNFRKKNSDECILILVIYWKKTGLLHTKISNHNIIYSS